MWGEQKILINLVKKDTFGKNSFQTHNVAVMFIDNTKTVLEGT